MIASVRRVWENFRGVGEAAVTVPPLDGALRSNRALEEASVLVQVDAPDDVAVIDGRIVYSAGNVVLAFDPMTGSTETLQRCDAPITAMALSARGVIAVGLDDGRVLLRGPGQERTIDAVGGRRLVCPTALMFEGEDTLVIAEGSASRRPSQWKPDLMERRATGSVWRVAVGGGDALLVARDLAWPYGLAPTGDGGFAVSESWRHRILLVSADGAAKPALADLPGYPARLRTASGGGYWLAVFAPRNQLIEFVQREPEFLQRMMAEIHPDHWAAPSLTPSASFLLPLQGGAQKQLGMLKPWAPSYSYGLVVRLDRQFRPVASYHSRADGLRHGVTGCVEHDGRLIVASKGGDAILALDVAA